MPLKTGLSPLVLLRGLALCLPLCLPAGLWAQGTLVKTAEVQAELVAHAPQGVAAGQVLRLGLLLRHAPHWHTYWKNPGDSGLPTQLHWQLPAGVAAGPIQWPTPQRLPIGPLVNYGYEGTVLLPVPVTVSDQFAGDSLQVKLRADWLVCRELCIPQSGEFSLMLPARASSVAHAAQFAAADAAIPREGQATVPAASVRGQTLVLEVQGLPAAWRGRALNYFAEQAGVIEHAARITQQWHGERLALRVPLDPQRSASPGSVQAVLTVPGEAAGIALRFDVASWPAPAAAAPVLPAAPASPPDSATGSGLSLWLTLAFAFIGGLLLNLMPCVFPILSLKVLRFAAHAGHRKQLVAGGMAYTAGVVLSFVALASLLLGLRAAGAALGWGFQLQSPLFVAALAVLFTLIGLNLLGVFEVGMLLPGNLAGLRLRHPMLDHGLTGVFAVAIASPCTAPFMGAALGAALTLSTPQALLVFAALGLGMAAPYLLASLWPGAARWLPAPGAWMAQFRTVMAFPMLATVVWLLWVLGQQVGIDGVAALLALLLVLAFGAWVLGSNNLGATARASLAAAALALLLGSLLWAWPALHEAPAHNADSAARGSTLATPWQRWSADVQARALADGRAVFVDFTAAWCVTCQFNKRTTLGDPQLLADLQARQVLLLRADWTQRDAGIALELQRLGRNGVPVYALYAPGASEAKLLSEILSVAEVRDALSRWPSAGKTAAAVPSLD